MRNIIYTLGAIAAVYAVSSVASAETYAATKEIAYWGWALVPLSIAIAVYAGTAAQAKTASTALEGIARNPNAADKIQTPMILSLALIESLVLFAWLQLFLFPQV